MGARLHTRLSSLFRHSRCERELDVELQFHLDQLTEQHIRAGLPLDAARRAALRAFGPIAAVKEEVRDTWLSRVAATFVQDIRYGARTLRRSPAFALVVISAIALGVGANTAIFSVVNGMLLRPLPYRDADALVVLRQQRPLAGEDDMAFSYQEILDYRSARSLEGVVEFHSMWFILLGRPEPERVSTGVVSWNFFDVLGVRPLYGRSFLETDERHGADAVLVLSHDYWQRSFGGDPDIVGRTFQMNDRPHQVVGVLPPAPEYPLAVDIYMPTSACPFRSNPRMAQAREGRMMTALARVKPGVTLQKTQADLGIVAAQLQQTYPGAYPHTEGYRTIAVPLQEELTRGFRRMLLVLLGTAGFVLLIVCASVANLMLARTVKRERELAVRTALGASRLRLLRQLLTESTLLALAGGLVGLAIAGCGVSLLTAFAERYAPHAREVQIDRAVLLYTFAIAVATGLIFGSVPAIRARRPRRPSLAEDGRATPEPGRVRDALIVVQVAASLMLLIGAGLTIRSLHKLQQVDPGFRTDNILTMRVDLNFSKYTDQALRAEFWRRFEGRLKSLPGVVSAGGAATFPLNDEGPFTQSIQIPGKEIAPGAPRPRVAARVATPDYFDTIGQPLVSGRTFDAADLSFYSPGGMAQPRDLVVIVNSALARRYWPSEDAVGKRIEDGEGTSATIVGVVADARQQLDRAPEEELYLPMLSSAQLSTTWLVRSTIDPTVMAGQIRAALRAMDPEQPVDNFRTLAEVRSAALAAPRLTAILLGLFGALALAITAAGIAGVVAFSVNQRTQEFGIRMALGARRSTVLAMVLRRGLQLVLAGLVIGLAGALVLTRLLSTLLFGIEPTDGLTYVAVSAMLVAVAAAACFVPARRAASVDPIVALRVG